MNTHKRFFKPRRHFDLHSTSRIFQWGLENKVAQISFVGVQSDAILISSKNDVLISVKNDTEHLSDLNEVLNINKWTVRCGSLLGIQSKLVWGVVTSSEKNRHHKECN